MAPNQLLYNMLKRQSIGEIQGITSPRVADFLADCEFTDDHHVEVDFDGKRLAKYLLGGAEVVLFSKDHAQDHEEDFDERLIFLGGEGKLVAKIGTSKKHLSNVGDSIILPRGTNVRLSTDGGYVQVYSETTFGIFEKEYP